MTANIPNALRRKIYQRDGWRCALCDSTDGIQIHHVIPRGCGGSDDERNLITLCWRDHAFIHSGMKFAPGAEYTPEDAEQACAEYVNDYYAYIDHVW